MKLLEQLDILNGGNGDLSTVTQGGTWTLLDVSDAFYDGILNIDGVDTPVAEGESLGANDNPDVDFTGEGVSDYTFFYSFSSPAGCSIRGDLEVLVRNNDESTEASTWTGAPLPEGQPVNRRAVQMPACFTLSSDAIPTHWENLSGGDPVRDAWYKFTTPANPTNAELVATTDSSILPNDDLTYPVTAIYSGTAPALTEVTYNESPSHGPVNSVLKADLNPSTEYYFRVGHLESGSGNYTSVALIH